MKHAIPLFVLFLLVLSGCASLFGKSDDKQVPKIEGEPIVKYSENPNMPPIAAREYHHVTRQKLEEESQLQAQAGSMWVMEGQGAYLFAQNKTRREGDLLNVKLEGAAQKEVETKVSVIKKLLKQLEEEERKAKELLQQQNQTTQPTQAENGTPPPAAAAAPARAPAEEKKEKEEEVKVESVATRIIERQPDGNYRVKGQQPFMIGNKEYKVIVTGVVRSEDFNDDGLSSNKILDAQYDVVSLRRKE